MKSINRLVRILVLAPLIALSGACGGGGGNSAPNLVSITVTPANPVISSGASQQFTATGNFSNGASQDITSQVTWTSTGLVPISATGFATAPASGAAGTATTITATLGTVSGTTTLTVTDGSTAALNKTTISVNGSLCSPATSGGYLNKPCVSVTICNPGTSTCQVVTDILLDTGSYGLRVFKQAIPALTLPQVASGTGSLAECIHFADLSTIWGPIKLASVQLGGEVPVQVPIQVMDTSFATVPSSCGSPAPDPASAGFTGILGVGPFPEDCGSACASLFANGFYFTCTGTTCSGTTVAIGNQVQNPVASLPQDNNGVVVQLPSVPSNGLPSVTGLLLFGIGTQTNNTATATTVLPTDHSGDFTTTFNGASNNSFADTGSNGLFFPSSIPVCGSPNQAFYCPPSTESLTATTSGTGGTPGSVVSFNIANFDALLATSNQVFSDVGGTSTFGFDWGLPFFMGRDVFFGISGKSSPLGTGPYVAY